MGRRLLSGLVPMIAILIALLLGAVVIGLAGVNPLLAYVQMFGGIFGSPYSVGETLNRFIPMVFAALGFSIAYQAGFFNAGGEGQIYIGALAAGLVGIYVPFLPWPLHILLVLVAGCLAGALWSWVAGWLRVRFGLTNYLYRILSAGEGSLEVALFPTIKIPLLADIPVLGPILFEHNLLVYLALLLVVLSWWFFYHTATGLSFRSAGENPAAADTAGINVVRVRYAAAVVSGMLAAMGGGFLTLTQVSRFLEDISHGRGWIALAAVIFGKWNPWGVMGACFLFGAATALQMQMQVLGVKVPYQVVEMIPYLLTMLALAGMIGRVRRPASLGKAYVKE